jgi:hypothetical protein
MSQVISFPAALHEFAQIALSPSINVAFVAEVRGQLGCVTVISVLSLERLAVSFTTAKLQEF